MCNFHNFKFFLKIFIEYTEFFKVLQQGFLQIRLVLIGTYIRVFGQQPMLLFRHLEKGTILFLFFDILKQSFVQTLQIIVIVRKYKKKLEVMLLANFFSTSIFRLNRILCL